LVKVNTAKITPAGKTERDKTVAEKEDDFKKYAAAWKDEWTKFNALNAKGDVPAKLTALNKDDPAKTNSAGFK